MIIADLLVYSDDETSSKVIKKRARIPHNRNADTNNAFTKDIKLVKVYSNKAKLGTSNSKKKRNYDNIGPISRPESNSSNSRFRFRNNEEDNNEEDNDEEDNDDDDDIYGIALLKTNNKVELKSNDIYSIISNSDNNLSNITQAERGNEGIDDIKHVEEIKDENNNTDNIDTNEGIKDKKEEQIHSPVYYHEDSDFEDDDKKEEETDVVSDRSKVDIKNDVVNKESGNKDTNVENNILSPNSYHEDSDFEDE